MMFDPKDYQETKPAPRELEPWQRLLLDAVGIIETKGLAKDECTDAKGGVCLTQAIREAVDNNSSLYCDLMDRVVKRLHLDNNCQAIDWNNAPERTASEVISALRGAALSDGE